MFGFLIFIAAYLIVALAYFQIVQRAIFLLYNHSLNEERMSIRNICRIYRHGIGSDLIIATYATSIPMLSAWLCAHLPFHEWLIYWLTAFNIIISLAIGLGSMADTVLYKFWEYKLDSSVFAYLRSLKGAFASVSALFLTIAFSVVFLVSAILFCALQTITIIYCRDYEYHVEGLSQHILLFIIGILLTGLFYLFIRGRGIRPHNPSMAYFSNNQFLNHAAINPLFNLIYSLTTNDDFKSQFRFFCEEKRHELYEGLFPTDGTPEIRLLKTDRPNIVIIVWESLCARFMETLGGTKGVCRNLDRLANEGVFFTHFDSGSYRTERGLVCTLSGYLAQPTASIIRYTRKLHNLPALPRRLRDIGYETMAVHGGDVQIMHKCDYYLASGHSTLLSQKDFPASAPTCKWGIQDGWMFDWLYDDIQKKTEEGNSWMTTFQTLSSHEPYTVPYDRLEDRIDNSFAYVDDCFGKFIDRLKQSPAWDNLLVIVTGDHGCNDGIRLQRKDYEHLPLLMLGGAIKEPRRIDTMMSQTDIAATLLGQMNLKHDEFTFSRDVLADTYKRHFTFHAYNNGFSFRDETGFTDYDCLAGKPIEGDDEKRLNTAKAIVQTLYDDIDKR